VFLLWNPRGGLAGVMWVVATFAFVFGLIVILAALGLRALAGKAGERVKERIEQRLKARGPESP
jgi:acid phosphatase family membrane protein YuiD